MTWWGHFSAGLRPSPALEAALGGRVAPVRPWHRQRPDRLIGWGRKPSWERARDYAERHSLPLWTLEDGFYRSLGLGVAGSPAQSLIADPVGIYFDATAPSRLEIMMQADTPIDTALRARAEALMARVREARLSKYNTGPDHPLAPGDGRPRVLVVDQTRHDASVRYGRADAGTFQAMLAAACDEHPEAEILVRTHPDVLTGRKQGYLLEAARARGCTLLAEPLSPWAVLDAVEAVYTVTSQLGFEALIAGHTVRCFGMPFYAGWGLTGDEQSHPRRGRPRDLTTLFANAVIRYPTYLNPYTGELCEPEDTIERLAEQYHQQEATRGPWLGIGLSRRKRRFIPQFLGAGASLRCRARDRAGGEPDGEARRIAWGEAAASLPEGAARAEDGFLRSVGLGVDMVDPLSVVIDTRGIYYDPAVPSDLEVILRETLFTPALRDRARALRARVVDLGLSKYNVGRSAPPPIPPDRRVVLVPGQVETDASIRRGAGSIRTNQALLAAARAAEPDAWIIYKPHPDVATGARIGAGLETDGIADAVVVETAMPVLLAAVDAVHTLTSLAGFEALLRGVPVTTYGLPFYAGWGLTEDRLHAPRRGRRLALDELVAGALIRYPRYRDPLSGDLIDVETAVTLLEQWRQRNPSARPALWQRGYRWIRQRH